MISTYIAFFQVCDNDNILFLNKLRWFPYVESTHLRKWTEHIELTGHLLSGFSV